MKEIILTLTNEKFFISDQTVKAAVRVLKKIDEEITEHLPRGKGYNCRIIHLKTNGDLTEMRSAMTDFIQNYDNMYFNLVLKKS